MSPTTKAVEGGGSNRGRWDSDLHSQVDERVRSGTYGGRSEGTPGKHDVSELGSAPGVTVAGWVRVILGSRDDPGGVGYGE